jgi:Protein of unknown function (DUF2927)
LPASLNVLMLFVALLLAFPEQAVTAEGLRPPPAGAPGGAPSEFIAFDATELTAGFLRLAFGSDMQRFSEAEDRIHKFVHRVRFQISNHGRIDRSELYRRVLNDFSTQVPELDLAVVDSSVAPDVIVRLVDAKDFNSTLAAALGNGTASEFIKQTNPRCTTRSRADDKGRILRADVFIVVDQGNDTFLDCAYHETLHAFGLMNHADDIPWTTLNQNRKVGYLSVYDRAMLQILYDRTIRPGATRAEVQAVLSRMTIGSE